MALGKTSTPNNRQGLTAQSTITGQQEFLTSTNGILNTTAGGGSGTQYAEGATTTPATGTVALGRYQSSPPTLTTGQLYAPQLDVNGNLKVTGTIASITSSIVPGTAATNLGKAEDAPHASADTGVFTLGVRNDGVATSFTSTNGDYNPVATDAQGRLYVVQKSPTSTHSNVSTSTTSATILAANTARNGASVYNDSSNNLYVATNGSDASATNFKVKMAPQSYFEVPAGILTAVTGVLDASTGAARVDEDT